MFGVAALVSDGVRDIERRDGEYLAKIPSPFNADQGRAAQTVPHFAEGNFIEAGRDADHRPVIGQSTS